MSLTPRQRAFVEKFVANGCNAQLAAISAGCSKARARQAAHECLKNEEVQALIEKRQASALNKPETANITDAYVLGGIRGLITRIEPYVLEQALPFLKGKRTAETSTNPQVLLAEDIARFYVAHPFRLLAGSGRNEF
jgi:hypothetical protein